MVVVEWSGRGKNWVCLYSGGKEISREEEGGGLRDRGGNSRVRFKEGKGI